MMLPRARSSSAVSRRGASGSSCTALWEVRGVRRAKWFRKVGGDRGWRASAHMQGLTK
jgi:hypothetical protein